MTTPPDSGVSHQSLIDRYRLARTDSTLAVLEGFHPLKHALRFGARVIETVTCDRERLQDLTDSLAPDLSRILARDAVEVPVPLFRQLSPHPPATGVISLARRPENQAISLDATSPAPIVLLENPRSHGNIGAAIRVAAAVGAAGVDNHRRTRPLAPLGAGRLRRPSLCPARNAG